MPRTCNRDHNKKTSVATCVRRTVSLGYMLRISRTTARIVWILQKDPAATEKWTRWTMKQQHNINIEYNTQRLQSQHEKTTSKSWFVNGNYFWRPIWYSRNFLSSSHQNVWPPTVKIHLAMDDHHWLALGAAARQIRLQRFCAFSLTIWRVYV